MQTDSMGDLPECKTLNASQMVPLRLVAHTDNGDTVLYDNPRPNNPHSCRPIRLAFEPENSDSIRAEHERLKFEIENLQEFKVNPNITINFKGLPTMVDGKVVSALTNKKHYTMHNL